jgi:hypothetical protein
LGNIQVFVKKEKKIRHTCPGRKYRPQDRKSEWTKLQLKWQYSKDFQTVFSQISVYQIFIKKKNKNGPTGPSEKNEGLGSENGNRADRGPCL